MWTPIHWLTLVRELPAKEGGDRGRELLQSRAKVTVPEKGHLPCLSFPRVFTSLHKTQLEVSTHHAQSTR